VAGLAQDRFSLTVLYPQAEGEDAWMFSQRELIDQPLDQTGLHPLSYLDSLILGLVERSADVNAFITWNARHFRRKPALPVLTPAEFLAR
jgi:hypothetical protein